MAVTRLLSIGLVAAVVASGATAAVGPTFSDPVGDVNGAPDITRIDVSSDDAAVTFAIRTADASTWDGAAAFLEIDTDANPATGNAAQDRGFELAYVLHSEHTQFTLDESNGVHIANPAATATLTGSTLTVRVPFTELETHGRIGFRAQTLAAGSDNAPDTGEWQFTPGAAVTAISASFRPAAPRHGQRFAVSALSTSFDDGTTGTAAPSCTARLGRVRLASVCAWRLPANSRKRVLTVIVRAAGLSHTYRFHVR